MKKHNIRSIRQKNRIIDNILGSMQAREHFLLLGHKNPDEDCISSLVAFGLLLNKLSKDTRIYLSGPIHEHYQYLLSIIRYNSIILMDESEPLSDPIDTLVVCDTPKPSMIEAYERIRALFDREEVLVIEVDHHVGGDSAYIGEEGYCLVNEASSACELIGHLALKLDERKEVLEEYQIEELFTRNLVLAILTGIIGDSNMGQYLKSKREKRYYQIFSSMFNNLLSRKTTRAGNFSNKNEVFRELKKLSEKEDRCYSYFMSRKRFSPSIGYVALNLELMQPLFRDCEEDTIVNVARAVADSLAEESGRLSLVAYYDNPEHSDLIEYRMRRSSRFKSLDLRKILGRFSVINGGGHEGAIGFRFPRSQISDFEAQVDRLIRETEEILEALPHPGASKRE